MYSIGIANGHEGGFYEASGLSIPWLMQLVKYGNADIGSAVISLLERLRKYGEWQPYSV